MSTKVSYDFMEKLIVKAITQAREDVANGVGKPNYKTEKPCDEICGIQLVISCIADELQKHFGMEAMGKCHDFSRARFLKETNWWTPRPGTNLNDH